MSSTKLTIKFEIDPMTTYVYLAYIVTSFQKQPIEIACLNMNIILAWTTQRFEKIQILHLLNQYKYVPKCGF